MKGAREYAGLFKKGLYGKLYIWPSTHARGNTLEIWVVPDPDNFKECDGFSGCVKVYDAVSGQRGWTEAYGWVHKGPWIDDFKELVDSRRAEINKANKVVSEASDARVAEEMEATNQLLSKY